MRRLLAPALLLLALPAVDGAARAAGEPLRLDGGVLSPNLVGNPSAERGEDGVPLEWTFEGEGRGTWSSEVASDGDRSLQIDGVGAWRSAPFPVQEGQAILLWADTRLRGSGRWGSLIRVDLLGADGSRLGKIDPYLRDEHSWTRQRSGGVVPAGAVQGVAVCYTVQDPSLTSWCDEVEVRQWIPEPSSSPASSPVPADVRRFDFGTPTSMVQPGYVGVDPATRYRSKQGYGWVSRVRLEGEDQTHGRYRSREMTPGGQPLDPNRTFLDPRTRDYIAGFGAARFRVDVPPGSYRVFLLAGHSRGDASPPYFDLQVTFAKVRSGRLQKRFPGIGFTWARFTAEADDRGLTVGLSSDRFGGAWALSAMLVYPVGETEAGDREAAEIQSSVEALPEDLLTALTQVPSPWAERGVSLEPPGLGSPRLLSGIWPEAGRPASGLEASASPGLFADLRFSLAADEALEGLEILWEPFRRSAPEADPEDTALPEDAVVLWHLRERYLRYTEGFVVHDLFTRQPEELSRKIPTLLPPSTPLPLWLRIRIPLDAAPGDYVSRLRVTGEGGASLSVPLRVRVLPFEPDAPRLFQNPYLNGHAGRPRVPPTTGIEREAARLRQEAIADVGDHLGSPALLIHRLPVYRKARGGYGVELAFLRESLEDHRQAGWPARDALVLLQPVLKRLAKEMLPEEAVSFGKHMKGGTELPEEYWTVFGDLLEIIDRELRDGGVERRLYNPWDESFGEDLPIFIRAAEVVRERLDEPRVFCNVPTTTFYGGPGVNPDHVLAPHCNAWWVYGILTPEQRRQEQERGTWLFGRFEEQGPERARAAAGLLRWRRREMGGNWWAYDSFRGSTSTHLDGPSWADRCLVYPAVPPAPRLAWEWTRVGHEDLRYLVTLERWSREGEDSPVREVRRAARKGARVLEELRESVDPGQTDPLEGAEDYAEARERVVEALTDLHEARSEAATDAPGAGGAASGRR